MVDKECIRECIYTLLLALGEDPARPGLICTPRRVADFWSEFVDYDPGNCETSFEIEEENSQMIVISGMRVWSLCEHHLLPFFCDVSIGYIARGRVLGLSKFGRVAQDCAHKLQIQERLVLEIADQIESLTATPDVAVIAKGEHLCMTMRGIKLPSKLTSSVMRGVFRENALTRAEFLKLVEAAG